MRAAVGPAPADEVARRQVEQDQADDAGPHHVAVAKNIAQQPGCRKLHRQGGHARNENCKVKVTSHGFPRSKVSKLYPSIILEISPSGKDCSKLTFSKTMLNI